MAQSNPLRLFVAVFLILGAGLACLWQSDRWTREDLRTSARQLAASLDEEVTRLQFFPRVLADDPRLSMALRSGSARSIADANDALLNVSKESGAAFSFLMNAEGKTVASSNFQTEQSFIGRDYSFRPYFIDAKAVGHGTFYAVGATTGVPGYFLAEALFDEAQAVLGVVVVKLDLSGFASRAGLQRRQFLVADDLDVAILSHDTNFLYAALSPLSDESKSKAEQQRRYTPRANFLNFDKDRLRAKDAQFRFASQPLSNEEWRLISLAPSGEVFWRASRWFALAMALLLIAGLATQLFRLQRRYAEQLEDEVSQKTRALEDAQAKLIAEENLAFVGRMSSAISHEINQPLASLRFNLATLGKLSSDEETTAIVRQSKGTAGRISRVIETLRLFARRKEALTARINLRFVVETALETMAQERPKASNVIKAKVSDHAVWVQANEVLMGQVIINLLTNAIDATKALDRPSIRLSLHEEQGFAVLGVEDNGPGVAEEMQADLFTPFASNKPVFKGLGLGLSLARTIVEDSDGTLDYSPQSDPFISRFILKVPLCD